MVILHIDNNHPSLIKSLEEAGHHNIEGYNLTLEEILEKGHLYEGIVIRSRFEIDSGFMKALPNLKFIARVGAGLESIDTDFAEYSGIELFSAPEGNRNAVAEHTLGMILSLFNKLAIADREVRQGYWNRESNRGVELDGKTVGIIGYGNMGKAFAKKLRGFEVEVLCYDIKPNVGDENALQVELSLLQERADIVSLHTPWTPLTHGLVNSDYINNFKKPFWFINTARGKSVITAHLVTALMTGKILGAGLDVLEYEKSSFESLFGEKDMPEVLRKLIGFKNVIFSPHIAGWTQESHEKLASTIANKIISKFSQG